MPKQNPSSPSPQPNNSARDTFAEASLAQTRDELVTRSLAQLGLINSHLRELSSNDALKTLGAELRIRANLNDMRGVEKGISDACDIVSDLKNVPYSDSVRDILSIAVQFSTPANVSRLLGGLNAACAVDDNKMFARALRNNLISELCSMGAYAHAERFFDVVWNEMGASPEERRERDQLTSAARLSPLKAYEQDPTLSPFILHINNLRGMLIDPSGIFFTKFNELVKLVPPETTWEAKNSESLNELCNAVIDTLESSTHSLEYQAIICADTLLENSSRFHLSKPLTRILARVRDDTYVQFMEKLDNVILWKEIIESALDGILLALNRFGGDPYRKWTKSLRQIARYSPKLLMGPSPIRQDRSEGNAGEWIIEKVTAKVNDKAKTGTQFAEVLRSELEGAWRELAKSSGCREEVEQRFRRFALIPPDDSLVPSRAEIDELFSDNHEQKTIDYTVTDQSDLEGEARYHQLAKLVAEKKLSPNIKWMQETLARMDESEEVIEGFEREWFLSEERLDVPIVSIWSESVPLPASKADEQVIFELLKLCSLVEEHQTGDALNGEVNREYLADRRLGIVRTLAKNDRASTAFKVIKSDVEKSDREGRVILLLAIMAHSPDEASSLRAKKLIEKISPSLFTEGPDEESDFEFMPFMPSVDSDAFAIKFGLKAAETLFGDSISVTEAIDSQQQEARALQILREQLLPRVVNQVADLTSGKSSVDLPLWQNVSTDLLKYLVPLSEQIAKNEGRAPVRVVFDSI